MIREDKSRLIEQAHGVAWADDTLTALIESLRGQGKIGSEADAHLAKLRAARRTLEFMARPDVVIELRRAAG